MGQQKGIGRFQRSREPPEELELQNKRSGTTTAALLPGQRSKRPAGILRILCDTGGKKAKMSSLEKSRLDWDAFKSEEGIAEELAIHNSGRGGEVERTKSLERVGHRQFELEKAKTTDLHEALTLLYL